MGSITIVAFLGFRLVAAVRGHTWSVRAAVGAAVGLAATFVGVNLMFLAPSVEYTGQTSLSLGYSRLQTLAHAIFGLPMRPHASDLGAGPRWPLELASTPGAYLGGAVLLGVWLCLSGRRRSLGWPFTAAAVVLYAFSLAAVADLVPQAVSKTLVGGLYIHAPNWLGYELVLVLPVLGALGLAAWPRASRAARRAAVGAAVTVAVVLPVLLGVDWQSSLIAGLGIVAAVAVLKMGERDQRLLWLLPLLLVGELGVAQVHPAGIWATRPLGTEPTDLAAYAQSPLVPPAILDRSAFTHRLTSPGAGRFIVADTSRARAHALAGRSPHTPSPRGSSTGRWSRARTGWRVPRRRVAAVLAVRARNGRPPLQLRAREVQPRARRARKPA